MRKTVTTLAAMLLALAMIAGPASANHDTSVQITSPADAAILPAGTTSVTISGTAVPTVNDIVVTLKTTAGAVVGSQTLEDGMGGSWDGNWTTSAFTVQDGESYEVTAVAKHGNATSTATRTFAVDTAPKLQPEVKEDCDGSGWSTFGFKNHGQCVRFVVTTKDSR